MPIKHNTQAHPTSVKTAKQLLVQLMETKCPSSLQLCISYVFLSPTDLGISLPELIFFLVHSIPGPIRLESKGLLSASLRDVHLQGELVCLVSLLTWHSSPMGTLTFWNSCWRWNTEPNRQLHRTQPDLSEGSNYELTGKFGADGYMQDVTHILIGFWPWVGGWVMDPR